MFVTLPDSCSLRTFCFLDLYYQNNSRFSSPHQGQMKIGTRTYCNLRKAFKIQPRLRSELTDPQEPYPFWSEGSFRINRSALAPHTHFSVLMLEILGGLDFLFLFFLLSRLHSQHGAQYQA